jgi:hypothetical protein
MDEQTATRLAAQQLVDQLGKPAGFMIALRLLQVIAERATPVTPELVEAFAAALKSMERFAELAGLDREERAAADADQASSGASADSFKIKLNGAGSPAGSDDDDGDGSGGRLA